MKQKSVLIAVLAVFVMSFMAFSYIFSPLQPDTPGLISPYDGEENVSTTPDMQWYKVTEGEYTITYDLQISTSNDDPESFESGIVLNKTGLPQQDNPHYQLLVGETLGGGTPYYWRVRACGSECSAWTEVPWMFTTSP